MIAIIGSSGLFPGSSTKEAFWDNLMQSKDLTGVANEQDFGANPDTFYDPKKGVVDKCYSLRGGYIRDFEFDANGYQLDAGFLAKQDKLFQWSLYVAKEALLDAGYLNDEALRRTGVILGNLSFPTLSSHKELSSLYTGLVENQVSKLLDDIPLNFAAHQKTNEQIIEYTPSEMVSKALGLGATHYALDAACATSLYAIKLACDELNAGKADMMLAGAICASDQLFIHMGFSIFHAYSATDKKFVPLDKDSAGLVSAEGAGMVILKRLADAERDGDHILGVIGGVGLSNDGQGKFLLSPNPKGQQLAFERAYEEHNINPKNTSYLECHATGTPLGDLTEINSISDFFKKSAALPLLGSVKSNMGHLLTAAGMSGLLKVLQAMKHEVIPPNLNLENPVKAKNGWIGDEQMITSPTIWDDKNKQAGINSFGFGGTNAHMIVLNYLKGKYEPTILMPQAKSTSMSIIGMEAHFGNCESLAAFSETIYYGKQHFKELPAKRWKGFEADKKSLAAFGLKDGIAPPGAYIDDFEIDLLRYKIQPKEAETLEPQQALILKVADKAIMDAGLKPSQNVAVLIAMEPELAIHHYLARWDMSWQLDEALVKNGISLDDKQRSQLEKATRNSVYFREGNQTPSQHTSFVGNIMASRIAALWDFSGPAFTVSCAEQSVYKALEIAEHMLANSEVEAVVVGGVDLSGGLENVLLRNKSNPVSHNLKPSISFEASTNGWSVGEGAGAIVLCKPAQAKDKKVYAVLDGVTSNSKNNSTADYIELNSSGIQKADQQEAQFLKTLKLDNKVALGSIKANIGNTFAASGIASVIKTAICVSEKFIPAIPAWNEPKEEYNFNDTQYYFPTASRPWIKRANQEKRTALINTPDGGLLSIIEGTTNLINNTSLRRSEFPSLLILKGETAEALTHQLSALEIAIESDNMLEDISAQFYDKSQTKNGLSLVILARTKLDAQQEINFFKKQFVNKLEIATTLKTPRGSYFTNAPLGKEGRIAFVYPGSSTAYIGLGKDIFRAFPSLHKDYEKQLPALDNFIWSDYLYPKKVNRNDPSPTIQDNAIAMMSVGVFHSAVYTHIIKELFECKPNIAFGYSMGECSSMWYSLGIWDANNSTHFQSSSIFQNKFAGELTSLADYWNISSAEAQDKWISLILFANRATVEDTVKSYPDVFLSFINTDTEVIISGDKTTCYAIATQLNCRTLALPFQNVIHHEFCRSEVKGLLKMHNFELEHKPEVDFYSSIKHDFIQLDSKAIAANSTEVCCQSVDFPKSVKNIYDKGARIFIELGANATCTSWINNILAKEKHVALSLDSKGKHVADTLSASIATLLAHQVELNISSLFKSNNQAAKKKSFYKRIELGGTPISEIFQDESLLAEFKNFKQSSTTKTYATSTVSNPSRVSSGSIAVSNTKVKTVNQIKKSTAQNMDTKMVSTPNKIEQKDKLGENGLRLQDFESGESLEGKNIIYSQADLEEFATGKIANVFGEEYSVIDSYSRRVMLPAYPYLLVSRVTGLKGKRGEFVPSTMQTEYDIPYDAWFTTDRQIPWAVSVESGQCDLMLISYLGIDFENKGELVYRLLDCTLTFVDDLPYEGQTLRYDISINSFVRNGENLLFFFSYRCYVEDRLVLKMDNGCAGFFRDKQLEEGNGVVYSDSEKEIRNTAKKRHFTPLLNTPKTQFSKADLKHLIDGRPDLCFEDESYFANGRNPSLCLPPEKILMIDRITDVDLRGGAYGLGTIVAEKDLDPNDWYFPCHFRDDEVLAGSLQAEGGGNLLRFFMLLLGLQRLTKDARYQPIFDLPQKVRCRKQVTPKDTKLIYKLEIKEIGLIPNPYVVGDLEIISDGVVTVHFENLGLQLREKDNPKYLETEKGIAISPRSEGVLMNEKDITTFALDDLSQCFGPDFAIYDGRTVSRQPNTDLQVISRVLKIDGERGNFAKPSTIYAEYDVPQDAWYYQLNATATMPYSILMEVALQPCGLLGAYLGSTLQFPDKNLFFRNLDGEGTTLDLPIGTDFRGKTISNKSVLVSSVALGGTVLQNYTFELSLDGKVFYKGKSSFGFFPADALAAQAGLDKGKEIPSWLVQNNITANNYMQIKLDSLYGKMKLFKAPAGKPHYKLSGDQLSLIDNLKIAKNQGEFGKGYVHATRYMKTYDWFFTCHFYQDPVMPGSLGVEAILQAMQTFALQQDMGARFQSPKFVQAANHTTNWKYRGQILLPVKEMHLEVHFKSIEENSNQTIMIADAYLWNDKMRIYHITNLALAIEEA